jgi:radical SAM superfamily enzyme YgiQ (UPF0313 family)
MGARSTESARSLLSLETHPIFSNAPFTVGLIWPNDYATGMSSLGYLWAYGALNVDGVLACERFVAATPCWGAGEVAGSLERNTPLDACDLIAVSISWELDFVRLVQILDDAGIPALAAERDDSFPAVVIGGPLCRSNPAPVLAIADIVVAGDGELAAAEIVALAAGGELHRRAVIERLRALPGCSGDPGESVCHNEEPGVLPVVAPLWTPEASLGELQLVEVSRGCPRQCTFCLGRRSSAPLRFAPTQSVIDTLGQGAPGIGLIGAALSYFPGLKDVLGAAAAKGLRAGISSLRADRVDREILELLRATGGEVLTIAADGASQRLRDELQKEVTEEAIVAAAELARKVGLNALKIYTLIGVPGETEDDLGEFVDLVNHLRTLLPVMVSVSIFVPKMGTPLATAPWITPKEGTRKMRYLLRESSQGIRYNQLSPREAALQALLSRSKVEDGPSLVEAARAGGSFADFKRVYKVATGKTRMPK